MPPLFRLVLYSTVVLTIPIFNVRAADLSLMSVGLSSLQSKWFRWLRTFSPWFSDMFVEV